MGRFDAPTVVQAMTGLVHTDFRSLDRRRVRGGKGRRWVLAIRPVNALVEVQGGAEASWRASGGSQSKTVAANAGMCRRARWRCVRSVRRGRSSSSPELSVRRPKERQRISEEFHTITDSL